MSRSRSVYRCSSCGADFPKWAGRCETCGEWNSLVEEAGAAPAKSAAARRLAGPKGLAAGGAVGSVRRLKEVEGTEASRWTTGLGELDFVLGGGIVPGSMVLVGGEPGIGKSTLLLQVAARLQRAGHTTLYVSGEESALQVKLRAERLGEAADDVSLLPETNLETILTTAASMSPAVVIVDSIQTVFTGDLEGAPGNVGQVRECAARLMRYAKDSGTAVLVVGHVTKGGGIAGPKTLEHIVDTVLYFEGENTLDHRLLRATKNRFGSVDEIGVFRMTERGLDPVTNPSELFVGDRGLRTSGSALTALLEGTRPLLVEIQALATKSGYGTAQRVATGYDARRLALLLAVLDKRAGMSFAQLDVFVNVVGGLQLSEPAGDLAVAAALGSSVHDRALPADAVFIGELGLGGEVRAVSQSERRIAEASNLGLRRAYVAERGVPRRVPKGVEVIPVRTVGEMLQHVFL
jgi:DNA repair protein RadA/Sms